MLESTQKDLARILGISTRRVRQLVEEGLFEKNPETRKYNLPKCVQEYIRYKIEEETGDTDAFNYDREKSEHESIKKDIAALRLRRIKGELHEARDVEAVISDMLVRFRGKILAIPTKLAPQLVGIIDARQAVDILHAELREALTELSEYNPADYAADGVDVMNDEAEDS